MLSGGDMYGAEYTKKSKETYMDLKMSDLLELV